MENLFVQLINYMLTKKSYIYLIKKAQNAYASTRDEVLEIKYIIALARVNNRRVHVAGATIVKAEKFLP